MTPKQSPAELEVSRIAARDIDGARECSFCHEVKPVMLLNGPGIHVCEKCFEDEGDET